MQEPCQNGAYSGCHDAAGASDQFTPFTADFRGNFRFLQDNIEPGRDLFLME